MYRIPCEDEPEDDLSEGTGDYQDASDEPDDEPEGSEGPEDDEPEGSEGPSEEGDPEDEEPEFDEDEEPEDEGNYCLHLSFICISLVDDKIDLPQMNRTANRTANRISTKNLSETNLPTMSPPKKTRLLPISKARAVLNCP